MYREISRIHMEEGYKIAVILTDGMEFIYDIGQKIQTVRFLELQEEDVYYAGHLKDGQTIHWSRYTELTLTEMLLEQAGNKPE